MARMNRMTGMKKGNSSGHELMFLAKEFIVND